MRHTSLLIIDVADWLICIHYKIAMWYRSYALRLGNLDWRITSWTEGVFKQIFWYQDRNMPGGLGK